MVDYNRATRGQFYFPLVSGFNLRLNLEAREEGDLICVQLNFLLVRGHHLADKCQRLGVNLGAVDQHLADILTKVVAHGANDDVGFTVD